MDTSLALAYGFLALWIIAGAYAIGRVLLACVAHWAWDSTVDWQILVAEHHVDPAREMTHTPARLRTEPGRIPPATVRYSLAVLAWQMRFHQHLDVNAPVKDVDEHVDA